MAKTISIPQQNEEVLPSYFCTIASRESNQLVSLDELQRLILTDSTLQARTEEYRQRLSISKDLAHETKISMPGITASVLMDGHGKELRNVVKPTLWLQLDFDDISTELMGEVIKKADADPHTRARFITTSGKGIRILSSYLPIDDSEVSVTELFDVMIRKAMAYYSQLLGIPADNQCIDITRMCGLAHDPTAYFRWDAEPFAVDIHDLKVLYTKQGATAKQGSRRGRPRKQKMVQLAKGVPAMEEAAPHISHLLEQWGMVFEPGRHNEYLYHFGKTCVRYGIDKDEAMQYAIEHFSADYPDTASVMKSCYKHLDLLGTWHFYRKGESYGKHPSAKVIKQWLSMRYEFHQNVVTGFYEVRSLDVLRGKYPHWLRLDDNIENSIWTRMDESGLEVSPVKLHTVVNSDFSEPWDPFDEYLRSLPQWDGKTDYISQLADRIQLADRPTFYHHTQADFSYYFKKWLVAMVVAWVSPKVVNQTVMIFVGKGGIFKTTFFHYLLPPIIRQYFMNDSSGYYSDKDFMEAFTSKGLICLDEFEAVMGRSLSAFKSCITKLVFSFRRPYDKYRSELLHRGALCGTSNSIQIISDDENRRYSPWLVESIVSPQEHPIDYTHVYAQAVALGKEVADRRKAKKDGWVYWLTSEDIEQMHEHNKMFMESNYMEDLIQKYYRVPEANTPPQYTKFRFSAEIMERIGYCPAISRNLAQHNLATVMLRLGFRKIHRAKGNGWLVVEKSEGEINTDAVVTPDDVEGEPQ